MTKFHWPYKLTGGTLVIHISTELILGVISLPCLVSLSGEQSWDIVLLWLKQKWDPTLLTHHPPIAESMQISVAMATKRNRKL